MTLLDDLRALGLPLVSRYSAQPYTDPVTGQEGSGQVFVSWTTDVDKIAAATEKGATIRPYTSTDSRFAGAEISCRVVEWDS